MPTFQAMKDADATLDFTIDWSDVFPAGDDIAASTWTCDDTGITIEVGSGSFTATTTTIWLSGGTSGEYYDVVNHVTTSDAREDDRTIRVRVYAA